MSNGHKINYDFGAKNNWRRWAWNRAKERISVKPKNAIVLYLPAKENLDMKVAIQKGFRPENMFAVERDPDVVKILRKQRLNVIEGDFNEVLLNWGMSPKFDIIMADFCCGITKTVQDFAYSCIFSDGIKFEFKKQSCVILNLQRGRDPLGKSLSALNKFDKLPIHEKHRGAAFLRYYFLSISKVFRFKSVEQEIKFYSLLLRYLCFEFATYKNREKRTVMDSIAFNIFNKCNMEKVVNGKSIPIQVNIKVRQKIAAAKAIRTMRLSA